eukprot:7748124-Alexandrium_andersonii.AAC.1
MASGVWSLSCAAPEKRPQQIHIQESPSIPTVVARFGSGANDYAEFTPRVLWGPVLRPFLGPRSSSPERLAQSYT